MIGFLWCFHWQWVVYLRHPGTTEHQCPKFVSSFAAIGFGRWDWAEIATHLSTHPSNFPIYPTNTSHVSCLKNTINRVENGNFCVLYFQKRFITVLDFALFLNVQIYLKFQFSPDKNSKPHLVSYKLIFSIQQEKA